MIQIGTGLFAAEVAAALTVCEGALFGRLAVVLATIPVCGRCSFACCLHLSHRQLKRRLSLMIVCDFVRTAIMEI
jgi:hypothetical protein